MSFKRLINSGQVLIVIMLAGASVAFAQSTPEQVGEVLREQILPPSVALFQLRQYILGHVAKPPAATSAREWTAEEMRLQQHLLNDVVFHGWPKAWVNSPPRFEDMGVIEGGKGYRIRKFRYEIVPGFDSVALLYEPENLHGKVPAILNVNGHVGPLGKAVEYKQKRCINFAKHGILALNLEWFSFGELAEKGNAHSFGSELDLVGANGLGIFYLEMRRGLDYLYDDPNVDRNRIGVTGLSGGGWQTIVLSSLDTRVKVSVPVAGYASINTRIEARKYGDLGDFEQNATDFMEGLDYTYLTAMMAPRPTLVTYDAEDNCCFRGPLSKPLIFDGNKPFWALYGKEGNFRYHENRDPGTHNYYLDNRLQAYRFFSEHFGMPVIEKEIPVGSELKSYDQLVVGLPKNNLTILGLARKMAGEITRLPIPAGDAARRSWADSERKTLGQVVRYHPVSLKRVWMVANTKNKGVETLSYLFMMNNGLTANGVWAKGIVTPAHPPVTIVLNDKGKQAAGEEVSDRVNRDEQVLALDLLLTGDAWKDPEIDSYAQFLSTTGERPLGMEAAQLIAIAQWIRQKADVQKVRLEASGIRSQVVATVAAALEPNLFSHVVVHEGMRSLRYLLDAPVTYQQAPELFCLDLYKEFDLDRLAVIASPTEITIEPIVSPAKETANSATNDRSGSL